METYVEMMKRHQEEFNNFPVAFAFDKEGVKEGLKKLGLTENDTNKVIEIEAGGFIKKEDKQAYEDMFDNHYKEIQEAIKTDRTGENFIKEMFYEELKNYDYGYTGDLSNTLMYCGITINDINSNPNIRRGLELAIQKYHESSNKNEEEEEEI